MFKPKKNFFYIRLLGFPIHILALLTLAYSLFPGAEKFFFLQHRDPKSGLYKKGKDDVYFVFTWIVLFTLLRAAIMEYVLIPLAKLGGVKKIAQQLRFAEQGWSFLYYFISWTLGMVSKIYNSQIFDSD
jgi:very-long-chain ceramide synthase